MDTLNFRQEKGRLICEYTPSQWGIADIIKDIKDKHCKQIKGQAFCVKSSMLVIPLKDYQEDNLPGSILFYIGTLQNDYYKIDKFFLKTNYNVYLYKKMNIKQKLFLASYNISILYKISEMIQGDIYIGGEKEDASILYIPEDDFLELIKHFPNHTELKKYTKMRIERFILDYIHLPKDYEQEYLKYINKKNMVLKNSNDSFSTEILPDLTSNEYQKYVVLRNKLQEMYQNKEIYSEKDWQTAICKMFTLLFPKYIFIVPEQCIGQSRKKERRVDFLLIDAQGYIDIVEIKNLYRHDLIKKSTYRDNYIPSSELSGTVMQVNKYIEILTMADKDQRDKIFSKIKKHLIKVMPNKKDFIENFVFSIQSPMGYVIMGDDTEFNQNMDKRNDFELLKKQYKNIIEIITYTDLIKRLDTLINIFSPAQSIGQSAI
jgi:hypothetical protein